MGLVCPTSVLACFSSALGVVLLLEIVTDHRAVWLIGVCGGGWSGAVVSPGTLWEGNGLRIVGWVFGVGVWWVEQWLVGV